VVALFPLDQAWNRPKNGFLTLGQQQWANAMPQQAVVIVFG